MEIIKDEYGRPCMAIGKHEEMAGMMAAIEDKVPVKTELEQRDIQQEVITMLVADIRDYAQKILDTKDIDLQESIFALTKAIAKAAEGFVNEIRPDRASDND